MMSLHCREVPCTVSTATPLDEATLTELTPVLKSFLSKGQVLKLEVKTDASIMGGMIGEKYVCKNQHSEVEQSNADFQSVDFLSVEILFFFFNS
uniref:Uncharacterized protein n=1 Tax=Moschus moschiferus TaxID=68415 RepID=A0A8C6FM50_MOSMO